MTPTQKFSFYPTCQKLKKVSKRIERKGEDTNTVEENKGNITNTWTSPLNPHSTPFTNNTNQIILPEAVNFFPGFYIPPWYVKRIVGVEETPHRKTRIIE